MQDASFINVTVYNKIRVITIIRQIHMKSHHILTHDHKAFIRIFHSLSLIFLLFFVSSNQKGCSSAHEKRKNCWHWDSLSWSANCSWLQSNKWLGNCRSQRTFPRNGAMLGWFSNTFGRNWNWKFHCMALRSARWTCQYR